jgi:hypothetical protein
MMKRMMVDVRVKLTRQSRQRSSAPARVRDANLNTTLEGPGLLSCSVSAAG